MPIPADAFVGDRLQRCLICPSHELFIRKDFPQRLGVAIVVLGFIASSIAWAFYYTNLTFVILFPNAILAIPRWLMPAFVK